MAVRFYLAAGFRCCLAESQRCATRRHPLAHRFLDDRATWPFVGLLALPRIFPAAAVHFCSGARMDCDGGLDGFFAMGSLAFNASFLWQTLAEGRIPWCQREDNSVRCSAGNARRECGGVRYR